MYSGVRIAIYYVLLVLIISFRTVLTYVSYKHTLDRSIYGSMILADFLFLCLPGIFLLGKKKLYRLYSLSIILLMSLYILDTVVSLYFGARIYVVQQRSLLNLDFVGHDLQQFILGIGLVLIFAIGYWRSLKVFVDTLAWSKTRYAFYVIMIALTMTVVPIFTDVTSNVLTNQFWQQKDIAKEHVVDLLQEAGIMPIAQTSAESLHYSGYEMSNTGSTFQSTFQTGEKDDDLIESNHKDVIILFLESFSAADSSLLNEGILPGRLPNFDQIQQRGTYFTNFISNSCTSDAAHIAVLQGAPNIGVKSKRIYEKFSSVNPTLPDFFKSYGYESRFYSTVTLDFLDQRSYLESLGFDSIIGEESFDVFPQYQFSAAPDEYLYNRIIDDYDGTPFSGGRFRVAQTISSHIPYDSPFGKGELSAFEYADQQLGLFVDKLEERNFFESGVLVVVGDHKKFSFVTQPELKKRGRSARVRSVAAMIGSGVDQNKAFTGLFQHTDLHSAIKQLIADDVSVRKQSNTPFQDTILRDQALSYCRFFGDFYLVTQDDGSSYQWEANCSGAISQKERDMCDYLQKAQQYYITDNENLLGDFEPIRIDLQSGGVSGELDSIAGVNGSGFASSGVAQSDAKSGLEGDFLDTQRQDGKKGTDTYPIERIAHQGVPALHPANSMAGFYQAITLGYQAIEFDITFSQEGNPVLIHGPDLGSISCGFDTDSKVVTDLSMQELESCSLVNGESILSLPDALDKIGPRVERIIIDIKLYTDDEKYVTASIDSVLSIISQLGYEDSIILTTNQLIANEYLSQLGVINGVIGGSDDTLSENDQLTKQSTPIQLAFELYDIDTLALYAPIMSQTYVSLPYDLYKLDEARSLLKEHNKIAIIFGITDFQYENDGTIDPQDLAIIDIVK